MSNNDINRNFPVFTEFKYPINHSLNNSVIEDKISITPRKDLFFHFKPQINMNNILLNMNNFPQVLMSDSKSPNKFSSFSLRKKEDIFDPSLFINGYNSSNKNNNNSEFDQDKINSNLYFNSKKKTSKNLLGKKRLFKYVLSSEKKLKNEGNINIDIRQLSLHGFHLINLQIIENVHELKNYNLPKRLIKFLKKKYKYFHLLHFNNSYIPKMENNLDKINLTLMELVENNLDYYNKETDCIKIIKNYCDDMNKEIEKIKKYYINKKNIIFVTKSILLLELLIRNCNLFTSYILKKINQINDNNKNINLYINNINTNSQKISPTSNSISPKFILIPPKPSISNINKQFINTLPENNNTTAKKAFIGNTNTNAKTNNSNLIENNLFINKQKTLFKAKIPLMNSYKCDFCDRIFKNGQALGGHISQSHPKQSNKYKQKIEIRNSRTERRELLYEAKRRLFKSYHIDYEYLLKNKRKNEIKMFIKFHKNEYKKELLFLKSIQRNESYNIPNKNEEINIKKILNTVINNANDDKKIFLQNKEK